MVRPSALALLLVTLPLSAVDEVQAFCLPVGATAAPASSSCWNTVSPVPEISNLEGLVWNAGRAEFIGLGEGGAILTSSDGVEWTPRDAGTTQRLYGAIWDGDQYVVVGEGGLVLTSPDAETWTSRVTNVRLALFDIAWNGDPVAPLYVAVGQNGTLLTSTDAVDWVRRDITISESGELGGAARPTLRAIIWGGTGEDQGFVAVGTSGTIVSGNGIAWRVNNYQGAEGPFLRDVAANPDGLLVAVGTQGSVFTAQGVGENAWSGSTIPAHPAADLRSIDWDDANERFIAVGSERAADTPSLIVTGDPTGTFGGGTVGTVPVALKTVAVGAVSAVAAGDRAMVRTGLDSELAWDPVETPNGIASTDLHDIVRVETPTPFYVTVGAGGAILRSPDGHAWSVVANGITPGPALNAVDWNGQPEQPIVAAAGESGRLLRSTDGLDWQEALSSGTVDRAIHAIAHGSQIPFVAVGAAGTILTSTDADSWAAIDPAPVGTDLLGVASDGIGFVAVGAQGSILHSTDGANWSLRESGTAATLTAVAWSGSRFVAVGTGSFGEGVVLTSEDGIEWTEAELPVDGLPGLRGVGWSGRQFMAAGDGGQLARSTDGRAWTTLGTAPEAGTASDLNALASDGERFVVVGEGGWILNSGAVDVLVALDASLPEDSPDFAPADQLKTFRFNVTNVGNLDAEEVVFDYTLPAGFQFAEPGIIGPAGRDCQIFGAAAAQCRLLRLEAGTGAGAPVSVRVITGGRGTAEGVAAVTALVDGVPGNNSLTFTTAIGQSQTPTLPNPDTDISGGGGAVDRWSLAALAVMLLVAARRPYRTLPPPA